MNQKTIDTISRYKSALNTLTDEQKTIATTSRYTSALDSLTKEQKTIGNATAVLTSSTDNIRDKTLKSWTADLNAKKDSISDKVLGFFRADITSKKDSLTDKTISGMTANLTTKKDSITDRVVGSITAKLTTKTDSIPTSDKYLNMTAKFTKNYDTSNMGTPWSWMKAWFNSYDTSSGWSPWSYAKAYFNDFSQTYTPTINAKANITDAWLSKNSTLRTVATGGVFTGANWKPITAYASGGIPLGGELFLAREAGPELVGTLGGHTAVMNNDQIVASVSDGVAQAMNETVVNAIFAAASQIIASNTKSDGGYDIEAISRGVTAWQKRQSRALGTA